MLITICWCALDQNYEAMKYLFTQFLIAFFSFSITCAQTTIILNESFSNNGNKWFETNDKDYSMKVDNGVYLLENKYSGSSWNFKSLGIDADQVDFNIETEIIIPTGASSSGKNFKSKLNAIKNKVKKGGDGSYGLVWAIYADNSDYHRFLIKADGTFYLDNYYNDEPHAYVKWTSSPHIKPKGEPNVLRVEKRANIVTFYINGQEVHKKGNNTYFGSKVGFFLNGNISVEVKSIIAESLPKVIPQIESGVQANVKERLSDNVNSQYEEVGGVISPDGNHIYIGRKYDPRNKGYSYREKDIDVWYSSRTATDWTAAVNMGYPLNNQGYNWVISVSPDNNTLLLANTYNSDGSSSGSGLSMSYKTANGWSVPSSLNIKGFYNDNNYVDYCLGPNKKVLLMAIENKDTYGQRDLYVSFLTNNNTWSTPMNLGGTINTFGDEESPFLAADNKTLYFGTEGHRGYGSNDIFITRRLDDTWKNWSEPLNIGPQVNTINFEASFLLSAKGDFAYFVSDEDIYKIKTTEAARPEPVVMISGTVYNSKTKAPLSADIRYFDLSENVVLGNAISDPSTGKYKIALPKGKLYGFLGEKDGFYSVSENIDLKELDDYAEVKKDLYLAPIEVGEVIRLNSVFFEFNKADLKSESYNELDRLYDILMKSPGLKIEIAGHTDDKGSEQYNMTLSNSRALSVRKYLLDKGISADRLKSRGYGETQPVVANDSEENRAYNRRVEFRVLSS